MPAHPADVTVSPNSRSDERHPDGQYSSAAKWFHWVSVSILFVVLASGATIRFMRDEVKNDSYTLHEGLGLIVLLVSVARLVVRRRDPPPAPLDVGTATGLVRETVHRLLYGSLIVQPLLGFLTTNAYGFPLRGETAFLWVVDFPQFMDASDGAVMLHWGHSVLGWTIVVLIVLHVSGVLYHHLVKGDGTLLRML